MKFFELGSVSDEENAVNRLADEYGSPELFRLLQDLDDLLLCQIARPLNGSNRPVADE